MSTYAYVVDGQVFEVVNIPEGLTISEMFTPDFVAQCVDVTNEFPLPDQRWTVDQGEQGTLIFAPPVELAPSPAAILTANTNMRDQKLAVATMAISPLQDAVDLDEATPEEVAALKKWKQYRVAVNRVDLKQPAPSWPVQPS